MANSHFQGHPFRIHANPKNVTYTRTHLDSGEQYKVIHNSLGFRQHREFKTKKAKGTLRIGVFGDSFTENLRMQAQYSFTEPLEYLLNEAGIAAEVLNFGTDGYGTDQSYLQYLDEGAKLELDIVFYIYCHNDLRDIMANRLFEVSKWGRLSYLPRRQNQNFWINFVRRFYLTYFLIEHRARLRTAMAATEPYDSDTLTKKKQESENRKLFAELGITRQSKELETALGLFRNLMSALRKETEERNQRLIVVLLPRYEEANLKTAAILKELKIQTLDLLPFFEAEKKKRSEFFFRKEKNPHWNEEGNKIAAVHIFKFLARRLELSTAGDDFIRERLQTYYSSFQPVPVSGSWLAAGSPVVQKQNEIRMKYLELERQ